METFVWRKRFFLLWAYYSRQFLKKIKKINLLIFSEIRICIINRKHSYSHPLVGITIVCPWLIAFPSNSSSSTAPCSDRPLAFWSPRLTWGFTWNEYLVAIRRFFTVIVYCLLFLENLARQNRCHLNRNFGKLTHCPRSHRWGFWTGTDVVPSFASHSSTRWTSVPADVLHPWWDLRRPVRRCCCPGVPPPR